DIYPDIPALDAAVAAMAAKLAGCSPEAMALLKAACWKGSEEWDQLLESRAEMSGKLVLSAFTAKAIAAFKQQ
ncbi:MAG: enoyl-CoA hydratase/isomerase family protein, partial [Calditrichaeota bacterium]|nr:enoyl-CoA hydratase/isomerase family protein [Calditrichota bacterium]